MSTGLLDGTEASVTKNEKNDIPLLEEEVPTVVSVPVNVRDVNPQSMCTYNWRVQTPHFQYIVPQGRDGVWERQGAWMRPAKPHLNPKGRRGAYHIQN